MTVVDADEMDDVIQPDTLRTLYVRQPVLRMRIFAKAMKKDVGHVSADARHEDGSGTSSGTSQHAQKLMNATIDNHRQARTTSLHMPRFLRLEEIKVECDVDNWWFHIPSTLSYEADSALDSNVSDDAAHSARMKEHEYCTKFDGMNSLMKVVTRMQGHRSQLVVENFEETSATQHREGQEKKLGAPPFPIASGLHGLLTEFLLDVEAANLLDPTQSSSSSSNDRGNRDGKVMAVVEMEDEDLEDSDEDTTMQKLVGSDRGDGISILKARLAHVDDMEHYLSPTYVKPPFQSVASFVVFDDSLKRHRTEEKVEQRRLSLMRTNRIISPILRIYFSLLHFGTIETKISAARWLCTQGRISHLINVVTMTEEDPQWEECHIGAKTCSVAREAFLRFSATAKEEDAEDLLDVAKSISNMWVTSIKGMTRSRGK